MEIRRFFVDTNSICNTSNTVVIDNEEYNHIVKVLRYKVGYKLIVSSGDNYDYHCIIDNIDKEKVVCTIYNKYVNDTRALVEMHLFAAHIKEENYKIVVQKAVELGVSQITPIITQYVNEKKLNIDKLNKVAREASKQSGRSDLVRVNESVDLNTALKLAKNYDLPIMAYEKEKNNKLKDILSQNKAKSIAVIIGPEGGFSKEEKTLIESYDIISFTLGRRILKAETASIVTLGIIIYEKDI